MKALKWMFVTLVLLTAAIILYTWSNNRNYFVAGETGTFSINVGEKLQFQLPENGSTGYRNCWINKSQCVNVQLVSKEYTGSLQSKIGYVGSGGRVTFQFAGVKTGVDTIAIARCPTGRDRKDCSEFFIDSVKPDNVFIVKVQ